MRRFFLSVTVLSLVCFSVSAQEVVPPPFSIKNPGGAPSFNLRNPGGPPPFNINKPGSTGVVLPPAQDPVSPEDSIPEISPGVDAPENIDELIAQPTEPAPFVPLADGTLYAPGSEIDPNAVILAGLCWAVPPSQTVFPTNALVALPGGVLWRPGDAVAPTQQVWAWFCQAMRAVGAEMAPPSASTPIGLGAVPGSFVGSVKAPEVGMSVIPIGRFVSPPNSEDPPIFTVGAEGFEPGTQPPSDAFVELRSCWAVPAASSQPPEELIEQARIVGGIQIPGVPDLWDGVSPLPPETYVPAEWCGWAKWALRAS